MPYPKEQKTTTLFSHTQLERDPHPHPHPPQYLLSEPTHTVKRSVNAP